MSLDIAAKKILQDYHSVLYKLIGVATDFVSKDGEVMTLCPQEHYNPLCRCICNNQRGKDACTRATEKAIISAKTERSSIVYECHAGLIDIVVPLFVNDQFIGCLSAGQILRKKPSRKSFSQFKQKVKALNLDENKLEKYYFNTIFMSDSQISALVELISLVGNYILESENKLLFLESVHEKNKSLVARQYMEQHYKKKLTIEAIAKSVFLSKSHFSHMFKREVGVSPINYVNRLRIEKAKDLLENTDSSITQIAYNVGFQSLPHFNRIFKHIEKTSPGLYRKSRMR